MNGQSGQSLLIAAGWLTASLLKRTMGTMVEATIRNIDRDVSIRTVHASRGKVTRAEPISALYEQGRVSHVGSFPDLEDQMCSFTSDFNRNTSERGRRRFMFGHSSHVRPSRVRPVFFLFFPPHC